MLYLSLYFLAIYLTIVDYALLSKKVNRFAIMLGIHLLMTVPSAYFLAKELTVSLGLDDRFYWVLSLTILLTLLSLFLSAVIVNKLR